MSNLGFEPRWVSSTTRNLTSWAKLTLLFSPVFLCTRLKSSTENPHNFDLLGPFGPRCQVVSFLQPTTCCRRRRPCATLHRVRRCRAPPRSSSSPVTAPYLTTYWALTTKTEVLNDAHSPPTATLPEPLFSPLRVYERHHNPAASRRTHSFP
jgi:hypothetical protein